MTPKPIAAARTHPSSRAWRWYFILAALEAGAGIALLFTIPREGSALSAARLAVLALLVAALGAFTFVATRPVLRLPPPPGAILPASVILAVLVAFVLYLLRYLNPDVLLPYFQRLSVPLLYALALCTQAAIVLAAPYARRGAQSLQRPLPTLRRAGVVWLVLLLLVGFVALTGLGITPDPAYWGEPGVAILGWQLFVAILCGLLCLALAHRQADRPHRDVAIAALIWLAAVIVWLSVPLDVLQNSFYAPIRPPANVPFPNSDAGYYDSMAHSLLIGYPYQGEIPSRPLYIVFLSGLHALFGERYDLIIAGQTLVLALIPVTLFCLGTAIHSRPAGVIAAVAAIGREWTSLAVSSTTRVSNTKMLLVDLPTLLVMLLACVLALRWLRRKDVASAAVAGGAFALLLLLRTQALTLLPVLIVAAVLDMGLRRRETRLSLAVFLAATALTLAPWLIHNYVSAGQFSLDAAFQYRIIASQYRYTGNLDIQSVDLDGKSLLALLATFVVRDPGFVIGFIANHALATQVGSVLALPLFHDFPGLLAGVEPYWVEWNGNISVANFLLVALYLGLIALGIASAWKRLRWAGLLPLGFSLAYSLANGFARFSGWRYDLPADWIAYFYLAAGIAEIMLVGACLFGAATAPVPRASGASPEPWRGYQARRLVPILAAFTLVGGLPWIAALAESPRYGWATTEAAAARLASSTNVREAGISVADIDAARKDPASVLAVGRVLYPRFFSRGTGLASTHPWPAYAPRDYPRLGFLLLNQTRHDLLLPSRAIPDGVQHGADAIVLGCDRDDYVEARLVLLPGSDVVIHSESLGETCE